MRISYVAVEARNTKPVRWPEVDVVLLDMDGTLLDLGFDNYFWRAFVPSRYGAHHGLSEAEARERLEARSLHAMCGPVRGRRIRRLPALSPLTGLQTITHGRSRG